MLTEEQRTRLTTLLGHDAKDVNDDNAVTVLLSYAEHITTEYTDAAAKVTELSAAEPEPKTLELSANEKSLLVDSAESSIELSAIKNHWPQAFTNAVAAFVKQDDGLLLSRNAEGGSRFKELLALLNQYPIKGLSALSGEQTGPQSITLSRNVPDAQTTDADIAAAEREATKAWAKRQGIK